MKQLIFNADVFDGVHERLIENASIIIEDNAVVEITQHNASRGQFDSTIDAKGLTAIPGLTDCHAHLSLTSELSQADSMRVDEIAIRSAVNARAMLLRGFTTVRDAGGVVFGLKKCIDDGYIDGPRIFPSHGAISQTCGHADARGNHAQEKTFAGHMSPAMKSGAFVTADGVPEVLRAVRDQLFLGASQIKVMAGGGIGSMYDPLQSLQFTFEELRAAVQAAEDFGTYVFAHIYTPAQMQRAAKAGVKCFEHAVLIDRETAKIIKDCGIWLDPQFILHYTDVLDKIIVDPKMKKKIEVVRPAAQTQADLINEFKLPTVFGTDLAMTKELVDEYQLKEFSVKKKLQGSFEGLKTATGNVHELFKLCTFKNPYPEGKIGVLESGSFADILLVDGNPALDLDVLANKNNIKLVMKNGKIYKDTRCQENTDLLASG